MTNQQPPELFAEPPVRSDFSRPGPSYAARRIITVCVLLALTGGGIYWAFGGGKSAPSGPIPTIKAEGAYKQKPEQPGGIDIPHQDVQVYRQIEGGGTAKPQVEHLLPPPETPQIASNPVPVPMPPPPTDAVPKSESLVPAPLDIAAAPKPSSAPPPPVVQAAPVAPVPVPPIAQAAPPPAPVKVQPAPKAAKIAAPVKGGSVIQLASMPEESAARVTRDSLQARYAHILGSAQLRLVRADLGAKGIYYRIQSQPVTETQARDICAAVKGMKAGCIVVHP